VISLPVRGTAGDFPVVHLAVSPYGCTAMNRLCVVSVIVAAIGSASGCGHVHSSQRERLASPAMQFQMDPVAEGQRDSILEITEGSTFPSAGPGTAGAGCGCN
jgi:Domain of unknown function (DUF4266)